MGALVSYLIMFPLGTAILKWILIMITTRLCNLKSVHCIYIIYKHYYKMFNMLKYNMLCIKICVNIIFVFLAMIQPSTNYLYERIGNMYFWLMCSMST